MQYGQGQDPPSTGAPYPVKAVPDGLTHHLLNGQQDLDQDQATDPTTIQAQDLNKWG